MWLNQDSLARSLIYATSTPKERIHIYPLISISRATQKYSTPNPGENSQKYFCFPLWNKCSSYLVTTTCYIISRDECSKKRYEEIKRSKCSEPRKKRKSETRGKNGQVSDSRIRGTRYPPERKEKENIEHLVLLKKFQKRKKGMYPLKRAKVELDFHHCYHHHHHTPFIRHTCTSWFDLLTCFSRSMVWLCNKCLVSMYTLSPTYELHILKPY